MASVFQKTEKLSQLKEAISWRIITEIWRRYPDRFFLIEAHLGGGTSDSLALLTRVPEPQFAMDVNRVGSVHVWPKALGVNRDDKMISDWLEEYLCSPVKFVDNICRMLGLKLPKPLPSSTPETLSCRFVSDFLAHTIGRLEYWECRNGVYDSSGDGGGQRNTWFKSFPSVNLDARLYRSRTFHRSPDYNFWFISKNGEPVICLDTFGGLFRTDGKQYDLIELYSTHKKIWPLIAKTVLDLLQ